MAKIQLRNSREIGDFCKPYIVAEINTSHFGNIDIAKEMIARAKEVGCDCVKFQSWSADTLYSKAYYKANPIAKRMVNKFSFSEAELLALADFAVSNGIDFSSTPYGLEEVDFLAHRSPAPFIKIASMELNNYPYLDCIAQTGVPMVLSTGMGDMDEIRKAVAVIENAGNHNICILHCVSIYPPETSTLRLLNIVGLREAFPHYPIGFSDHSAGIEMACASVALGACLIEKHFTLDRSRIGMDNQMATEPEEMARMVAGCHNVQLALGGRDRVVPAAEVEQRKRMRRSVVAARSLAAGTRLKAEDLDVKRPGTGYPPEQLEGLIGRLLSRDVEDGQLLSPEDFAAAEAGSSRV